MGAYRFRIVAKHNIIYEKFEGLTSVEDFHENEIKLEENFEFSPELNRISDFTYAIDKDIEDNIDAFLNFFARNDAEPSKVAILSLDPNSFVHKIVKHHVKGLKNTKVFSTVSDACEWLEVNLGVIKPFVG